MVVCAQHGHRSDCDEAERAHADETLSAVLVDSDLEQTLGAEVRFVSRPDLAPGAVVRAALGPSASWSQFAAHVGWPKLRSAPSPTD